MGFLPVTPALADSVPQVEYTVDTAPLILEAFAVKYGIESKSFIEVAKCESGVVATTWNKADPHGGSKGVFQFQPDTFKKWSKEASLINADVWNPYDNIETAAYMFSKKQQKQWSCWSITQGSRSP